jgi:hypothetical protein
VSGGLPGLLLLHRIDVRSRSAIDRTDTVASLSHVYSSRCYCSASTVFPTPGDLQQGTVGNPGGCSPGLAIVSVVQCAEEPIDPVRILLMLDTHTPFDGCFVLDITLVTAAVQVSRPDQCFTTCANFDFAVIGGLPTTVSLRDSSISLFHRA